MKKNAKRAISAILALVLALAVLPALAYGADYEGHWAEAQIGRLIEKGVVTPDASGNVNPNGNVTRAQLARIIVDGFDLSGAAEISFTDVAEGDWFYDYIAIAVGEGFMSGYPDNTMRPNNPVTRQEASVMFVNVGGYELNADEAEGFADASAIGEWAKGSVGAAVENGIMSGLPGNLFGPTQNMTRAQAFTVLDNMMGGSAVVADEDTVTVKANQTYGQSDKVTTVNNLIVDGAGATVKNVTVTGDLTITEGVGNGDVVLEGVVVKGDTIVKGGGANSIVFRNGSQQESNHANVIVLKVNVTIRNESGELETVTMEVTARLTVGPDGTVDVVIINTSDNVTLTGTIESVEINAGDANVQLSDAIVKLLTVNEGAAGARITISSDSAIDEAIVDAISTFLGSGIIGTMAANSPGIRVQRAPAEVVGDHQPTVDESLSGGGDWTSGTGGGDSGYVPSRSGLELLGAAPGATNTDLQLKFNKAVNVATVGTYTDYKVTATGGRAGTATSTDLDTTLAASGGILVKSGGATFLELFKGDTIHVAITAALKGADGSSLTATKSSAVYKQPSRITSKVSEIKAMDKIVVATTTDQSTIQAALGVPGGTQQVGTTNAGLKITATQKTPAGTNPVTPPIWNITVRGYAGGNDDTGDSETIEKPIYVAAPGLSGTSRLALPANNEFFKTVLSTDQGEADHRLYYGVFASKPTPPVAGARLASLVNVTEFTSPVTINLTIDDKYIVIYKVKVDQTSQDDYETVVGYKELQIISGTNVKFPVTPYKLAIGRPATNTDGVALTKSAGLTATGFHYKLALASTIDAELAGVYQGMTMPTDVALTDNITFVGGTTYVDKNTKDVAGNDIDGLIAAAATGNYKYIVYGTSNATFTGSTLVSIGVSDILKPADVKSMAPAISGTPAIAANAAVPGGFRISSIGDTGQSDTPATHYLVSVASSTDFIRPTPGDSAPSGVKSAAVGNVDLGTAGGSVIFYALDADNKVVAATAVPIRTQDLGTMQAHTIASQTVLPGAAVSGTFPGVSPTVDNAYAYYFGTSTAATTAEIMKLTNITNTLTANGYVLPLTTANGSYKIYRVHLASGLFSDGIGNGTITVSAGSKLKIGSADPTFYADAASGLAALGSTVTTGTAGPLELTLLAAHASGDFAIPNLSAYDYSVTVDLGSTSNGTQPLQTGDITVTKANASDAYKLMLKGTVATSETIIVKEGVVDASQVNLLETVGIVTTGATGPVKIYAPGGKTVSIDDVGRAFTVIGPSSGTQTTVTAAGSGSVNDVSVKGNVIITAVALQGSAAYKVIGAGTINVGDGMPVDVNFASGETGTATVIGTTGTIKVTNGTAIVETTDGGITIDGGSVTAKTTGSGTININDCTSADITGAGGAVRIEKGTNIVITDSENEAVTIVGGDVTVKKAGGSGSITIDEGAVQANVTFSPEDSGTATPTAIEGNITVTKSTGTVNIAKSLTMGSSKSFSIVAGEVTVDAGATFTPDSTTAALVLSGSSSILTVNGTLTIAAGATVDGITFADDAVIAVANGGSLNLLSTTGKLTPATGQIIRLAEGAKVLISSAQGGLLIDQNLSFQHFTSVVTVGPASATATTETLSAGDYVGNTGATAFEKVAP